MFNRGECPENLTIMNKFFKKFFNNVVAGLIQWCAADKSDEHKRAFFVVLCDDKGNTHVAFSNTLRLTEVMPCAVSVNPDVYAMFESVKGGVDCLCDDDPYYNSDEWINAINELPIEFDTERWLVFDKDWRCNGFKRKEVKHDR